VQEFKHRSLSWKIARNTQLAKAIKEEGWQVAWVWVNIIASVDHFGRMEGTAYALRDLFFGNMPDVIPDDVERWLQALENVGLLIRYQNKSYLQLPKIGVYQKISGNMSPSSDYPDPPEEVINTWKSTFNDEYKPLMLRKVKPKDDAVDKDEVESVGAYWNDQQGLIKINHWNEERIGKTKERLQSTAFRANWKRAIDKIAASSFCKGGGSTGWRASYDWFIRNDMNWIKAVEGKYDDRKRTKGAFDDILKPVRKAFD
jgi:hypothetical protein